MGLAFHSLRKRDAEPELIDDPDQLSPQETSVMLEELALVNRWLGGTKRVWEALEPNLGAPSEAGRTRILDVGSGSGDIPAGILEKSGQGMSAVSVDFNFQICRQALERKVSSLHVVQADVFSLPFRVGTFDLIACTAFLHHFSDSQIVAILKKLSTLGKTLILSDLHRSLPAYWGISVLTQCLSRSRAIRNDGPLSVRKGFRKEELTELFKKAQLECLSLKWGWAFRYTAVLRKET